jgi:RHH-type proline utilization regulon transcriptional repressor/proline dehydrogenase/delta 1-pyrroline-5-carboxylate dehydrogenase
MRGYSPSLISAKAFMNEQECIKTLLAYTQPLTQKREAIFAHASTLVENIRSKNKAIGIEAFLQAYGLDTHEGVAIMCMAEALLRIPDIETTDRLIANSFAGAEWDKHLGADDSLFINASRWALLLTGKTLGLSHMAAGKPSALLGKLIGKVSEPIIREALKQAMRFLGSQFVLGETIEDALNNSRKLEKENYHFSYDILGEGARTKVQATYYLEAYRHAILTLKTYAKPGALMQNPSISIKLSALHPRYQLTQEARVMDELYPALYELATLAMEASISVSIDAEESSRLDLELTLFTKLFTDPAFEHYNGIGFVLQAYNKRAFYIVDYLASLAATYKKSMAIRLVKGAYWDSEIKNAQVLGLPSYPVFTHKDYTDISYLACAKKILSYPEYFYPQFATHNALTVAALLELAQEWPAGSFEFQRLYGMGEALYEQLGGGVPRRIYAPVGEHKDLLAYLIRRLLENGANSSFVHLLMDKEIPLDELLRDPVANAQALANKEIIIPEPVSLFSDRKNSRGYNLGNRAMLEILTKEVNAAQVTLDKTTSSTADDVGHAMAKAKTAFPDWQKKPVEARAQIIERYAELLEENQNKIIALIIREAGRTLSDAISELREAIDFCYYYALQARSIMADKKLESPTGEHNSLHMNARGIFACISPWNFPLSIFTGQIVAALVTGNCVITKPAEQTPSIAHFAVELLYLAGVPRDVLHLFMGTGETIGNAITSHEHIAGVVFTGSMETARIINRALANRKGAIIPFIAETGGQNCMIVDSSALLEQVTDDVIASAFGSAGQRCSALRVLYVQDSIADALVTLIAGAMTELHVGDPLNVATDIGPVIDADAQQKLQTHIDHMHATAKFIAATSLATNLTGNYIAPHAFEIDSIHALKEEIFGPVLHIIRYKAAELEQIVSDINSTGYGLTFGLQSRISDMADYMKHHIHAGNIYVNRSMIGATVGVQPFGGEGLSGTGPKAGGPYYLLRFLTERTFSINIAAIGGNIDLLSHKS